MEYTDKEKIELIKEALRSFNNNELSKYATLCVIETIVADPPSEEEIEKAIKWAKEVFQSFNMV